MIPKHWFKSSKISSNKRKESACVFNPRNVSMTKNTVQSWSNSTIQKSLVDGFTRNGIDEITPNYDFQYIALIIFMFSNPKHDFVIKFAHCSYDKSNFRLSSMNVILFKQPTSCLTRRLFTFRHNPCVQQSQCNGYKEKYNFQIMAIGVKKNSRFDQNMNKLINGIIKDGRKEEDFNDFVNINLKSIDFDIHSIAARCTTNFHQIDRRMRHYHVTELISFRPQYTIDKGSENRQLNGYVRYLGIWSHDKKDFTDEYCFDNHDVNKSEFETTIEMRYNHVNKQLSFWRGDIDENQILIGQSCRQIDYFNCDKSANCFHKGIFTLSDKFEYYPVLCTIGCSCRGKQFIVSYRCVQIEAMELLPKNVQCS